MCHGVLIIYRGCACTERRIIQGGRCDYLPCEFFWGRTRIRPACKKGKRKAIRERENQQREQDRQRYNDVQVAKAVLHWTRGLRNTRWTDLEAEMSQPRLFRRLRELDHRTYYWDAYDTGKLLHPFPRGSSYIEILRTRFDQEAEADSSNFFAVIRPQLWEECLRRQDRILEGMCMQSVDMRFSFDLVIDGGSPAFHPPATDVESQGWTPFNGPSVNALPQGVILDSGVEQSQILLRNTGLQADQGLSALPARTSLENSAAEPATVCNIKRVSASSSFVGFREEEKEPSILVSESSCPCQKISDYHRSYQDYNQPYSPQEEEEASASENYSFPCQKTHDYRSSNPDLSRPVNNCARVAFKTFEQWSDDRDQERKAREQISHCAALEEEIESYCKEYLGVIEGCTQYLLAFRDLCESVALRPWSFYPTVIPGQRRQTLPLSAWICAQYRETSPFVNCGLYLQTLTDYTTYIMDVASPEQQAEYQNALDERARLDREQLIVGEFTDRSATLDTFEGTTPLKWLADGSYYPSLYNFVTKLGSGDYSLALPSSGDCDTPEAELHSQNLQ